MEQREGKLDGDSVSGQGTQRSMCLCVSPCRHIVPPLKVVQREGKQMAIALQSRETEGVCLCD